MTIVKIFNIISIISGFLSSLWFIKGTVTLNGEAINRLAGTYWDQNPHLLKTLVIQKVEYTLGALFLCFAFFVQLLAQIVPLKLLQSRPLTPGNSFYFLVDIIILYCLLSWWTWNLLKAKTKEDIKKAKQKEYEKQKKLQSLQDK